MQDQQNKAYKSSIFFLLVISIMELQKLESSQWLQFIYISLYLSIEIIKSIKSYWQYTAKRECEWWQKYIHVYKENIPDRIYNAP